MINNSNENEIVRRVKVKLLNHGDIILLLPSWFYFTAKIYPCVYAYLRIRVFAYTRICVHAYMRICVYAYMRIWVFAYLRKCGNPLIFLLVYVEYKKL